MGERCDGVHVICDAIAGGLGGEFVSVVLGELIYANGPNLVKVWSLLGLASHSRMAGSTVPVHFIVA